MVHRLTHGGENVTLNYTDILMVVTMVYRHTHGGDNGTQTYSWW